jgi:Lon protease-like protein
MTWRAIFGAIGRDVKKGPELPARLANLVSGMPPQMDPDTIPLFPLANVVLFPNASIPLYVFEPRYRQLTEDALAGFHRIGMIAVPPEHADALSGDPPLFEIGCEGRIAHAGRNPDGTYQILLQATRRFRILEELPRPAGVLYRSARVEGLPEPLPDRDRVRTARRSLFARLAIFVRRIAPAESDRFTARHFESVDDARLVSALAQAIGFDVLEKQRLLEAPSVLDRYELMDDLILFRLAELSDGPGSGVLH